MSVGALYLYPRLEERLLLLAHLVEFSELPVILLGPEGSGKSTVASRLADPGHYPHWQPVLIEGGAGLGRRQVLPYLYEALDLGSIPPGGADTQLSAALAALRQRFAYLRHVRRLPVLVIDDADRLATDALALFARVAETGGARLVLLAESIPTLSTDETTTGRGQPHQLDLPPLAREDVAGFVAHLVDAGIVDTAAAAPLTERELLSLHESSGGRTGALRTALQAQFREAASRKAPSVGGNIGVRVRPKGQLRPFATRLLASVVAAISTQRKPIRQRSDAFADLIAGASQPPSAAPEHAASMPEARPFRRHIIGLGTGIVLIGLVGFWVNQMMSGGGSDDRDSAEAATANTRVLPLPSAERAPLPTASTTDDPGQGALMPPRPEPPVPFEPEVVVDTTGRSAGPVEPVREAQTLDASDRPPQAPMPLRPQPSRPETRSVDRTAQVVPAATTDTPETDTPDVFQKALSTRPDSPYLIQLLGSRDPATIDRYVAGLSLPNPVYVAQTTHLGKPWFIVLIGGFSDRAEASAEISKLPEFIQKTQPWPRDLASLGQADLRRLER